ncbi:MiaB/RimO family radical SAM methylthiotransferase [candidate division WOR-3 bacterium]|nr:MiaB/RimO family radical SAM methylthiotransferase [candidate division WOR-3 bacterium]
MKNFFIDFNGCQRNHIDAELISAALKKNSFDEVHAPERADVLIFLGCGFTEDARKESIETILEMYLAKKKKSVLVVGGCIFRRHKAELKKNLPEVDLWVDGSNPALFLKTLKNTEQTDDFSLPELDGPRNRMGLFHVGLVKISEGCLNNCSYCAIPFIRGPLRSREIKHVTDDVKRLQDEGCTEIILVSQDSTAYGKDKAGKSLMPKLLGKMEKCVYPGVKYRIPYLHPNGIDDRLAEKIAGTEKMIKCLDIPVQHFSDKLLKKMNRNSTGAELVDLFSKLRQKIPGSAFRTTFIVGFPGETDRDVAKIITASRKIGFERSGVFIYSREDNTQAKSFQNIPARKTARKRYFEVKKNLDVVMLGKDKMREGLKIQAIIDGYAGSYAVARTDWDMPDVDKAVFIKDEKRELQSGIWTNIKIVKATKNALYAVKAD